LTILDFARRAKSPPSICTYGFRQKINLTAIGRKLHTHDEIHLFSQKFGSNTDQTESRYMQRLITLQNIESARRELKISTWDFEIWHQRSGHFAIPEKKSV
jgi:hypothetical protein